MPSSYRELVVWQKSMDMAVAAYEVSRAFPGPERFGMTAQLRRAAVSVPTNIAEGSGRGAVNDFRRFLAIARGSAKETETLLILAERIGFVTAEQSKPVLALLTEITSMLAVLRKRLSASS
jgi:four helix bundle protein